MTRIRGHGTAWLSPATCMQPTGDVALQLPCSGERSRVARHVVQVGERQPRAALQPLPCLQEGGSEGSNVKRSKARAGLRSTVRALQRRQGSVVGTSPSLQFVHSVLRAWERRCGDGDGDGDVGPRAAGGPVGDGNACLFFAFLCLYKAMFFSHA